jgi:alcohol dehydrogenase class IV
MRTTWNFFSAGQLTFGAGAVRQLGQLVTARGLRRLLIISDANLAKAGLTERVLGPLREAGVETLVFEEGEAEPSIATAERAIALAGPYRPDGLLGLGGGSNMDLAKIVATVVAHGGSPRDYLGFANVPGPVLPLVCVPTTAGTGSEVSHAAVLTDTEQQMKVSTLSNYLRPALAVVDPQLTASCPPQVTADSGIDALTHAIEAYTATDYDKLQVPDGEASAYEGRYPLGDCLAEKAIALVGQHLRRAVEDGGDESAREGMALAATLAGLAFSNCGVALVHALEYPLGGALHCSHGGGNGLLLPYVMRFNLPERQATLARIAALLGEDTRHGDERRAAEQAIEAVVALRERIGIPLRIRDLGGKPEQLEDFADKSFAIKRLLWVNPRRATRQDLLEILQAAY